MHAALREFHPAVSSWFEASFDGPTPPQLDGWPAIQAGRHTLIAAPTGSGKTLAAFLCAIDELVQQSREAPLEEQLHVLYLSPLKALSNDIEKNLQKPLRAIDAILEGEGAAPSGIRTMVRTGDTKANSRAKATKHPPNIFVTTPESFFILLTSEGGRRMLSTVRTVIIDEIHALVAGKRGSHLSVSLERLDHLVTETLGKPPQRIGLSATQKPIEEVARFLVGTRRVGDDGTADCHIVDGGHVRELDLAIEIPRSPLETVMSNEVWEEIHDRLAALIEEHRTTLVFVNTRRLAERLTRNLSERLGEDAVTSHHGSLSRKHRLEAEQRLKSGSLKALVATASLELGIDIGDVDLVCQVGATRTISAFLQRIGRAGHHFGGVPKGRLFPLSRDELLDATALLDAVRRGELDELHIPPKPLDLAAQQMVAALGAEPWDEDALFELIKGAWPYRNLSRDEYDRIVAMLAEGYSTQRGRRSAHIHHDAVNGRLRGRRGARLAAITSGGAIPDNADYTVLLEPTGFRVGSINEDFAIESMPGDIFQLGNTPYRILKVESGKVRVQDATGELPTIPFWLGEAPSRSPELSHSVSRLRQEMAKHVGDSPEDGARHLQDALGMSEGAAQQCADYIAAILGTLGAMPTQETLVLERFFDEAGGMHLVIHAPFGSRMNRAWGLALRKRFCRKFNFELQAAANEDAIVLSLGPTHSFPLDDVWRFLNAETVRDVLVQALLDAPMFQLRWRWNATRALSVLRFRGGKKVPAPLQRMNADDLLTVCFPDQVACLENVVGDREIPDHPLVQQTVFDCLHEAMDIEGLENLLRRIEGGELTLLARDLTEPSPLATEILNARPYAFLDDAPLEERRTRAVLSRRWLDPKTASDLGALDTAAIERVRAEAWPDPRDAEELHDGLVLLGFLRADEVERGGWTKMLSELTRDKRAGALAVPGGTLWVAAERVDAMRAIHPGVAIDPPIEAPARDAGKTWKRDDAIVDVIRARLEGSGPVTAAQLAERLGVEVVDIALAELEGDGFVLRGHFTERKDRLHSVERPVEWCERRLLARIHRYTINRLRKEIEPVTSAAFMRFLFHWQHVHPDARLEGPDGVAAAAAQLEGFEAHAAAWEADVLPGRVSEYDPAWLDALCLSGRVAWARRTPSASSTARRGGPVRSSPVALMRRSAMARWLTPRDEDNMPLSSPATALLDLMRERGACFFDDLLRDAGLLRAQLVDTLGELVSHGLVTSDGYSGLRALLAPADKRRGNRQSRRAAAFTMESAGRWAPLPLARDHEDEDVEAFARLLLQRWGVVFRRLLDREGALPPWRDLLRVYRRLEARGEIRGGRFVQGFSGEQYALPEAVGLLRKQRRAKPDGKLLAISASDPLNLVGIVTPGKRVSSIAKNRLLYRDGVPLAVREGGTTRILEKPDDEAAWDLESALTKRKVPIKVRAYLGNAV